MEWWRNTSILRRWRLDMDSRWRANAEQRLSAPSRFCFAKSARRVGSDYAGVVDFGARFWPRLRGIRRAACVFWTKNASSFWTGKNADLEGAVQNHVTPADGAKRGLRRAEIRIRTRARVRRPGASRAHGSARRGFWRARGLGTARKRNVGTARKRNGRDAANVRSHWSILVRVFGHRLRAIRIPGCVFWTKLLNGF